MIDAAKAASKKLMIGYRLRYEPFNQTMIEMAQKKAYGAIRSISADNVQDVVAPNIRLSKKLGGGALGDVGVYCINACRYITAEEPAEVSAQLFQPTDDPRFAEVEDRIVFTLKFPSGVIANCSAGFSGEESRRYRVHCADGFMELDPAFSYTGLRLHVKQKSGKQELNLSPVDHFAAEMDHFSDCVLNDKKVRTPGEEGLADMKVMAAIYESARTGKTVKL